jgi:hypothetical protein
MPEGIGVAPVYRASDIAGLDCLDSFLQVIDDVRYRLFVSDNRAIRFPPFFPTGSLKSRRFVRSRAPAGSGNRAAPW